MYMYLSMYEYVLNNPEAEQCFSMQCTKCRVQFDFELTGIISDKE